MRAREDATMMHFHRGANATAHTTDSTGHATGRLIHWARGYDVLVRVLTLGRERKLRDMIADLAALQPGESVLDVGCGTGTLALVLSERVGQAGKAAGIDPSPEMIARARMKARKRGRSVDFRQESADALSFPDQHFDAVVSSLAVHHLTGGVAERSFGEMGRVLKPGGRVCLVDFLPANGQALQASTASGYQPIPAVLARFGFEHIATGQLPMRFLPGLPALGYVMARQPGA